MTVFLHAFRSPASFITSMIDIPMSSQYSFLLSVHFFFGLPLVHWPLQYLQCTAVYSRIYCCSSESHERSTSISISANASLCPNWCTDLALCRHCLTDPASLVIMPHNSSQKRHFEDPSFSLCSLFFQLMFVVRLLYICINVQLSQRCQWQTISCGVCHDQNVSNIKDCLKSASWSYQLLAIWRYNNRSVIWLSIYHYLPDAAIRRLMPVVARQG